MTLVYYGVCASGVSARKSSFSASLLFNDKISLASFVDLYFPNKTKDLFRWIDNYLLTRVKILHVDNVNMHPTVPIVV